MRRLGLKDFKSIVVLTDISDMVVNNHIDFRLIQEIYAGLFIIRQLRPAIRIAIIDKHFDSHNHLWAGAPPFHDIDIDLSYARRWESANAFDAVICHPKDQYEVFKLIQDMKSDNCNPYPFPLFVLRDYLDDYPVEGFADKFEELFDHRSTKDLDEFQLASLQNFKKKIRLSFTGFGLDFQERLFAGLLKNLGEKNASLPDPKVKNILFLDDHRRKFYIGDSYVWLMNIRSNVFNLFKEANLTINCQDTNRYQALNQIFSGSWEPLGFENKNWNEINFREYDLILYHNDLTVKFLSYVSSHYSDKFSSAYILSLFDTHSEVPKQAPNWNYNSLYRDRIIEKDPFTVLKNKKRHSELRLSDSERDWADSWLLNKGVQDDAGVVALIINTSKVQKMLRWEVQVDLVRDLVLKYKMKVLIFDDKSEDLEHRFAGQLELEVSKELIYASGLGIRGDLSLLSSRFIISIVSPCTGLMHLANGVYRYLLNAKKILRSEMPIFLVYAGNLKGITDEYHPKGWWANTLVRCIVMVKDANGENVVTDVLKMVGDVEEFNRISLPVAVFNHASILAFINENLVFKSVGFKNDKALSP
ncbi:hypothetical protein [Pedobacter sp. GR22-10]|uniref:hypothetical protein n=1 Tax=Pedobacter sp. GR22-10 TaxID=2994472 RepID=UPI0022460D1F|nr:hypothetical protein [Pedobacter sp. GR22-10]MCX2431630.1 hypothetical protein [Pedobacter sp. GR22-10]